MIVFLVRHVSGYLVRVAQRFQEFVTGCGSRGQVSTVHGALPFVVDGFGLLLGVVATRLCATRLDIIMLNNCVKYSEIHENIQAV